MRYASEIDPPATVVADHVGKIAAARNDELSVFWLKVAGARGEYRDALASCLENSAILIVRGDGFRNPNSVMVDLTKLIETNRGIFEELFTRRAGSAPQGLTVMLLARTELAIPQSSSPVAWPEWVPHVGGLEVSCHIEDISREIVVQLDAPSIELARANRALHSLERALVRRLSAATAIWPESQNSLFECLGRGRDSSGWRDFLDKADAHSRASRPDTFRPSVRRGDTIVSRLWGVATDQRQRPSLQVEESLGEALGISLVDVPNSWRPTIFSALARQSSTRSSELRHLQFLRDVVVSVVTTCQLITSAHHAGEYAAFPLHLARALVDELQIALLNAEAIINQLSDVARPNPL